ncbi:MAG: condensation domain-containing protein [Pseudomonadota bacterium]
MHCDYSSHFHQEQTVERLLGNFSETLRGLIQQNAAKGEAYPLVPIQEGLLFHWLENPSSDSYCVQYAWRMDGETDWVLLKRAWACLVEEHAILRTRFSWVDASKPRQTTQPPVALPWHYRDMSELDADEQKHALAQFLEDDLQQGFDLSQAPLMRFALIKLSSDAYYFLWTHHHILMDGWSLSLLLQQLKRYHALLLQGQTPRVIESRRFFEYAEWLRWRDLSAAEAFWRGFLKGFDAPADFKVETPVQQPSLIRHVIKETVLPFEVSQRLRRFAASHHVTLNTLVQGAWALLLHRYCQTDDIVYGVTHSGRSADFDGIEEIVGPVINTLPLRIPIPDNPAVGVFLERLQQAMFDVMHYSFTPLTKVHQWSDLSPYEGLFNAIIVFENYPASWRSFKEYFHITEMQSKDPTHYPLTLVVEPDAAIRLQISYLPTKIPQTIAGRLLSHYRNLLLNIMQDVHQPVFSVSMLSPEEYQQLMVAWNQTARPYPREKSIPACFDEQVAKTPEGTAVFYEGECLTYRVLQGRADRLAREIRGDVEPNALVGSWSPHSPANIHFKFTS